MNDSKAANRRKKANDALIAKWKAKDAVEKGPNCVLTPVPPPPRKVSFVAKGQGVVKFTASDKRVYAASKANDRFWSEKRKAKEGKAKKVAARWDTPEHRAWSRKVKDKCGRRCVVCGSSRSLRAHHLMSWADNIEHRFNINNGVAVSV